MTIVHPADSLSYPIGQARRVAYHEGAAARAAGKRSVTQENPYPLDSLEWTDFVYGWADEINWEVNNR